MQITNVPALKINKLTHEQFKRAIEAGRINDNEMYLTPDNAEPYIIPMVQHHRPEFSDEFNFSGEELLEVTYNNRPIFIFLQDAKNYSLYSFAKYYDDESMWKFSRSYTEDGSIGVSEITIDYDGNIGAGSISNETDKQSIQVLNDEVQALDSNIKTLSKINQSTYNLSIGYGIIPLENAGELLSVANNGNIIVAMYEYALYTSLDGGQTWPYKQNLSAADGEIVYGNGKFVIANSNGNAYYSEDGINWTSGTEDHSSCIAFGNGYFITTYDRYAYYSTDGITWTQGGTIGDYNGDRIIYIPSAQAFMILGPQGDYSVSTDNGITWTQHSSQGGFDSDSLYCITNAHIIFVKKFDSNFVTFTYSTNALNFSTKQFNNQDDIISSILYNPNTDIITIFGLGGENLGYYLKASELETIEDTVLPNITPPTAPILWESSYCYNDVSKKVVAFGDIINGDANMRVFVSDGIDFSNNASIEYNGQVVTEKVKQGLNIPTYIYSTEDLTAGVSELPEGTIYIVYE